jgi:8-oxo-dGTP diphosphatase
MNRAGEDSIAADVSPHRRVVVDVILLLMSSGRVLLRERANTGYGDGAYEPPSDELADRETIVETAIRVASAAGIVIGAENVSLAHVMHDVSGGGRIAFFLSASGWVGQPASPDMRWFPVGDLPTNMLDRARVALRNYVDGMRFSTYPAFVPAGGTNGFHPADGSARSDGPFEANESNGINGLFGTGESNGSNGVSEAKEQPPWNDRNDRNGKSDRNDRMGKNNRTGNNARNGSPARRREACGGRVLG